MKTDGARVTPSDFALQVESVSKVYRLYDRPEDRLKHSLFWRIGRSYGHDFWALRDVSFQVRRGQSYGILGRNGSGKSTLLQIIAGTLQPTTGNVSVKGRVAALLELGSGFNPEFSGRDNVFLNGALLGLSEAEVRERLSAILAFADIGEFVDQPVKTYSSGMLMRLAFSVAIHVDADILIVDEALSVGDMFFQTKCMAALERQRRLGRTILFVSHSMQTIKALCDHALLLDRGELRAIGDTDTVCDQYAALHLYQGETKNGQSTDASRVMGPGYVSVSQPPFEARITERTGRGDARYVECCVFQDGREVDTVIHGRSAQVIAWLQHHVDLDTEAEVGILVRNLDGLELFGVNSHFLGKHYPPRHAGECVRISFEFPVTLAPGTYNVVLGLRVPVQAEYWDKVFGAAVFKVIAPANVSVPGLYNNQGRIKIEPDTAEWGSPEAASGAPVLPTV